MTFNSIHSHRFNSYYMYYVRISIFWSTEYENAKCLAKIMSWMIDFYSHRWKIAVIKLMTFSFKWTTYYICLSNGMKRIVCCQEFLLLFIVHDYTKNDMKLIGLMTAFVISSPSKSFHVISFYDNNAHNATMSQCHWWAMKIQKIIRNQPKP